MPSSPSLAAPDQGNGPADLLLVQAALRGEGPAIDALLQRLGCVARFVQRLNAGLGTGLPTSALEDVVQQVYAALWPKLREFHGHNPLETWVFAFCRNCLRGAARASARQGRARSDGGACLAELPGTGPEPGDRLADAELLDRLHDELAALPPAERAVVEARHLHGVPFEDLARRSGVAVSTIKDRCYRAMQRLQERFGRPPADHRGTP